MSKDVLQAAYFSLDTEKKEISRLKDYLDEQCFLKAVDALANCKSIMTVASGSSGIAAKKFAHSLCCINKHAMFMPPSRRYTADWVLWMNRM